MKKRTMHRGWVAWMLAGLCGFASGCGYRYKQEALLDPSALHGMKKVVVLPFENLSSEEKAGALVADIFANELIALRKMQVYERPKVQEFLQLRNIRFPKVIDRSFARQLGKIMEVDGVFYGSVTEFVYRLNAPISEQEEPIVGLNARLLEVRSGRIVWVSTRASSSYAVLSFQRDPLSRVAAALIGDMLSELFREVPRG